MIVFRITSHPDWQGVRLSRPGHWGGDPYATDDAAEAAAVRMANGRTFTIERQRGTVPKAPKAR